MSVVNDPDHVRSFKNNARQRWTFLNEETNARQANKYYKKNMSLLREMHSKGIDINILQPLLYDESDYVRLDAACVLLFFCPEEARAALEEISDYKGIMKGMLGITAEAMLAEWQCGNVTFEGMIELKQ